MAMESPRAEKPQAPHAIEAEQALLGAILFDNAALGFIPENLSARHFHEPFHARLFSAIVMRHGRGEGSDPAVLASVFQNDPAYKDLGGIRYLMDLVDRAPPVANAGGYGREIMSVAGRRQMLDIATTLLEQVFDPTLTTEELLVGLEREVGEIHAPGAAVRLLEADEAMAAVLDYLDNPTQATQGILTGLEPLDEALGPWLAGDLVVLGARPGMGKSAIAGIVGANVAAMGYGVIEIHGEMTEAQAWRRRLTATAFSLFAAEAPAYANIRRRRISFDQRLMLDRARDKLAGLPLVAVKRAGMTLPRLRALVTHQRARFEKKGIPLGLVTIDHVGLITTEREHRSRVEQQTEVSNGMKVLADSMNIPILALAQLSRQVESRDDKRPQLSDLRDSGCLTGETRIFLPETGTWARIDSLVGTTPVIAAALSNKIGAAPCSRAFFSGQKPVWRLTTGSGRQVRATANHKFLREDGWVPLETLAVGDSIATAASLPHFGAPTMSHPEAMLLGHLIGDGCILPRHAVQYTTKDEDLAELVGILAKSVFGDGVEPRSRREINKRTGASWLQVFLASSGRLTHGKRNPVCVWFENLGIMGLRSHEKRVPQALFTQPPSVIAAFLRHLWATDGTIVNRVRPSRGRGAHPSRKPPRNILSISYATSSPGLAQDIHDLLLVLGIKSRVGHYAQGVKGRHQHPVTIIGLTGARRFVHTVGIAGERKTAKVEEAKALLASCGVGDAYDRDLYWDLIVSIEADGGAETYDLSVPDLHNFVANGIVVHNSWEQDADVVIGVYRDAYYAQRESEPTGGPGAKALAWSDWDARRKSPWIEASLLKVREGSQTTVKLWAHMPTNAILGAAPPDDLGGMI